MPFRWPSGVSWARIRASPVRLIRHLSHAFIWWFFFWGYTHQQIGRNSWLMNQDLLPPCNEGAGVVGWTACWYVDGTWMLGICQQRVGYEGMLVCNGMQQLRFSHHKLIKTVLIICSQCLWTDYSGKIDGPLGSYQGAINFCVFLIHFFILGNWKETPQCN